MDLNNILKMITPEMIGAIAPLLIPSETPTKKTFQTPSETPTKKTFQTPSETPTKKNYQTPSVNDDTPTESPKTTEKQDDLEIFDDMLRKILPILLKTVFKLDPTLETLVRDTLKEIDQENNISTEEDIIDNDISDDNSSLGKSIAENLSDHLTDKPVTEIKDNTLITDYFKSKGSVSPPKQSEEDDITFLKYYSEDKDGNIIPDDILNVYAFCRSKPDTYIDVEVNEWNHIFSLKSMMYASIITEDENAIQYLGSLLDITLTRKDLLEFYSYLERLAKPRSTVQEIVTGLYFKSDPRSWA